MDADIRLFIPAEDIPELHPYLTGAAEGRAEVLRERPRPVLRLDSLRCLRLSLFGSGEHVRTPFVFPFVRTDGFNFDPPQAAPHELPGPDWLCLGHNGEDLGRFVAQGLSARKKLGLSPRLLISPFADLAGPLPQEERADDVPLTLCKSSKNFNQPAWAKNVQKLLELPEERWGEVGISNTADQMDVFAAALDRLVLKPPKMIVDLGCGLGQIARSLALRYPQAVVVGVDASAEAIAVARKAFRLPNLKFAVVDFSRPLNFPKAGLDLIVSTNALPYAQNQLGSARELFGLLAPEGVLLNHCRAEESQLFWDFPKSAVLPTNTQIFLSDWFTAAAESGRRTSLWQSPLGMSAVFFQANPARPFSEALNAFADARRHQGPQPYAPWASHVLLTHAAQAQAADETALPLAANHFRRLEALLAQVPALPGELQDAAITAWIFLARILRLRPQALAFLAAAMPRAAGVLEAVLGPALKTQDETPA